MSVLITYLIPILGSTVYMATPLIFASVGGAYSVRGGVMALGLESMMMMGAFCGVVGSYYSGSVAVGFLCGILGGMLIALLHAFLCVNYKVNQVISGVGLNLLATAATTLMMQVIWGNKGTSEMVASVEGTLSKNIPILNAQSFNFVVMIAVVIIGWVVLFKTQYGLRLRMVGENPKAASAVGLRVWLLKYSGVLICGALAGYGGAFLSLDQLNMFVRGMTAGRGYIAVAINILGRYNPANILIYALLFGFCDAVQIYLQGQGVPAQLIQMLPYVVTLIVLAVGVKHIQAPAGVGKHETD
ncbi:MAG: ABC transporter permease [Lachnospiraceae bacterium]|nr:ABC transporter permease [Lachnospiraceae bacterium]